MTWLLNLTRILPSVRTMAGYALAACLVAAMSGLAGWRLASDRCDASKAQALTRAIEQSQEIASQDAEILASQATRTITIYKLREDANAAIDDARIPADCSIPADSLRAIRALYPTVATSTRRDADVMPTAAAAEGREVRDDDARVDRRSVGVSTVRGQQSNAD